MSKAKKKVVETPVVETPVEAPEAPKVEVATEESTAKKDFRAFIERLKATNPRAYQKNEAELQTKLNQL